MVHLDEHLVRFDVIALVHVHLRNVAVHPREDVDLLVGLDVGRVDEADVEVLPDGRHRPDRNYALFARVFLGAAADEAKGHERNQRQDEDAGNSQERMALQMAHEWEGTLKISCSSR